jgi:histidine triad (HIT) family protein
MSDQCVFCKIINKEIPASLVHEDDTVVVFKDLNPQAPVHLLVVPKVHIPSLNDLQPEHSQLLGHALLVASDVAKHEGLAEDGWRLVVNCGDGARQTVFHLHIHLLGGRLLSGQMA